MQRHVEESIQSINGTTERAESQVIPRIAAIHLTWGFASWFRRLSLSMLPEKAKGGSGTAALILLCRILGANA